MRRTIDGKRYDTETANQLGARQGELNPFLVEALYKTRSGSFFTTYVDDKHEVYSLCAMSKQEALRFAEEKGLESVIDKEFADLIVPA